jgi:hypothetical protein
MFCKVERTGKVVAVAYLKYYPSIYLLELMKILRKLSG